MNAILVVAKAPVAGQAKTRLAATVGPEAAADLAAAALLDTLEACASEFKSRLMAFTGDFAEAARAPELAAALEGWHLFPQRGSTFGERLVNAHIDAFTHAGGPVIQVGMDTPQITAQQLGVLQDQLVGGDTDALLGLAEDGGWWVLGITDPRWVEGLAAVPMSTTETGAQTLRLLQDNGARVELGPVLRDVDTAADATAVSQASPDLRFSSRWTGTLEAVAP